MRLVVQREGAGTSGREREQPGEDAGGGGSGSPHPTGAGLGPAETAKHKVSQRGCLRPCVCVCVCVKRVEDLGFTV